MCTGEVMTNQIDTQTLPGGIQNMAHMRRRAGTTVLVACALAFLSSCTDLTSGGLGEVEVYASAHDPSSGGQESAPAEGTLLLSVRTYVQADGTGEWLELTAGPQDISLDLRGAIERRAGVRFVSDGRYTRFRVVFEQVTATLTGGLVVGGEPLLGQVTVDMGDGGALVVERELALDVRGGASVDLWMNLNAQIWLATASPVSRTVAASALRDAVALRVR